MTRILSTEELVSLRRSGNSFAFLNVLSAEQYAKDRIPGSNSAPIDDADFMKHVEARTGGDKNMTVVVYCSGNSCDASARAARALESAGYHDVLEYSGGMAAWLARPHQDGGEARPTQAEMASISAAVRAGESGSSIGQSDPDDEQELELAGSERGAERENWSILYKPQPRPTRLPQDEKERKRPDDASGNAARRAAN